MVRIALLILILTGSVSTAGSQTVDVEYFKDRYLSKSATQSSGKFSQTTTHNADGSLTLEVRNLRQDKLLSRESYKGDEQVGVWLSGSSEDRNFDFTLRYESGCVSDEPGITNYLEDMDSLRYAAPRIAGYASLNDFLSRNIRYPDHAVENGISGRVRLRFTVDPAGEVGNIVVTKGSSHVQLDKEAVRVLRMLRFSKPPVRNGKPYPICVDLPVSFRLD